MPEPRFGEPTVACLDLSVVDPDNRRRVDHDECRGLLQRLHVEPDGDWRDDPIGVPKLWLIHRVLADRRRRHAAFAGAGVPVDGRPQSVSFR